MKVNSRGYLTIKLLSTSKLPEMLVEVTKAIKITNPGYDNLIKRLYIYIMVKN